MNYKCYEFPADETSELIKSKHSIQKVRTSCLKKFIEKYDLQNIATEEEFFSEYQSACNIDVPPKSFPIVSSIREALCDKCYAIKCGDCQIPNCYFKNDFCLTCSKNPESLENIQRSPGQKCFLHQEFKECKAFILHANEDVLSPADSCQRCYFCDIEETGTECVHLHDIPLAGYPTEVIIYRKTYANSHAKSYQCKRTPLPGLQSSYNSTYTCRLHRAVTTGTLKGCCRAELSEWYNINYRTLSSMIKLQAASVEGAKANVRCHTDPEKICSFKTYSYIADKPCVLYFLQPFPSDQESNIELVGIYSEDEIEYLVCRLMENEKCERPSSLTSSCVFSMAFDYACQQMFGPPEIFAYIMVIADLFYCNPIDGICESYWVLHYRMIEALKQNEPISVLLNILHSILKLLPISEKYLSIREIVDLLFNQLTKMENSNRNLSFDGANFFNESASRTAIRIADMISVSSKDIEMTVDEIRDRLLFFNQAVVPYRYNIDTGEISPMFSENGLIDTAHISSVGIRCSCLELLISSGLLMVDTPIWFSCKENRFHGKTGIDLENRQNSACEWCECQNLCVVHKDDTD